MLVLGTIIPLLLSALPGALDRGQATPATAGAGGQPPVVVASGTAVVTKAPDVAYVALAVESRAASPREAQRQNADRVAGVIKRLTELSIPAGASRTTSVRLEQEYDMANGRRTPRDFLAHNSLDVRVDDISRAGEVADAAVQGGATSIDGIRFDLKDRSAADREAIRLAVADARARAEAAAAGAGRTLDRILKIEDVERAPMPRPMMAVMREGVTPIEPGLIDVHASVTVTASMK